MRKLKPDKLSNPDNLRQRGFTLIEVMVTFAILGILGSFLMYLSADNWLTWKTGTGLTLLQDNLQYASNHISEKIRSADGTEVAPDNKSLRITKKISSATYVYDYRIFNSTLEYTVDGAAYAPMFVDSVTLEPESSFTITGGGKEVNILLVGKSNDQTMRVETQVRPRINSFQ